jgi:hypothetical protein
MGGDVKHTGGVKGTYDPKVILQLLDHMENDTERSAVLGVSRRTIVRWRQGVNMLNLPMADELAIRLGYHIGELWPDVYFDKELVA